MDSQLILNAFLLGIPLSYVVKALILEEKDSHVGPFKFKNWYVVFPDTNHVQNAALFDVIRNAFGVYKQDPTIADAWVVDEDRAERWTCPFCLSFWAALIFSIPFVILNGDFSSAIPIHLTICVSATLFVGAMNYALRL